MSGLVRAPHPAVSLREAGAADAGALATLAADTFRKTFGALYPPEDLAVHLAQTCSEGYFHQGFAQGRRAMMAEQDGAWVGYVQFGAPCLPVTPAAGDAEIYRLYVQDFCQGTGIAACLFEMALAEIRRAGGMGVYLGVWEHNLRAQRFYHRYGFTPVGEYGYPVGRQMDRELILYRPPNVFP